MQINKREIFRWLLFAVLLLLGLVYLNSAFYSAWVSSGPPNDYPQAWAHRAVVHLGYSGALLATAIMVPFFLKTGFAWKKSKLKYLWIVILLYCFLAPVTRKWLLVDKCLDSGGQWDDVHFTCKQK